jgi:hypothetical protein
MRNLDIADTREKLFTYAKPACSTGQRPAPPHSSQAQKRTSLNVREALELIDETVTPNGTDMKLMRRVNEQLSFSLTASLMSSRMHGSEEAATSHAGGAGDGAALRTVGGLGMGFHATRDARFPPVGRWLSSQSWCQQLWTGTVARLGC